MYIPAVAAQLDYNKYKNTNKSNLTELRFERLEHFNCLTWRG